MDVEPTTPDPKPRTPGVIMTPIPLDQIQLYADNTHVEVEEKLEKYKQELYEAEMKKKGKEIAQDEDGEEKE